MSSRTLRSRWNRFSLLPALAFALAAACGPAGATTLLNVQFGQSNIGISSPTVAYHGAAVAGNAGDQWNQVLMPFNIGGPFGYGASNLALTDITGAATGVTMSYHTPDAAIHWFSAFTGGPYDALMSSYLFADGRRNSGSTSDGPGVVTFSGLVPDNVYHLFVYSAADTVGRGTRFTSGDGMVSTVVRSSGQSNFVAGATYADMAITSTSFGQLSLIINRADDTGTVWLPEGDLNGLQLQGLIPSAVPEPGTGAMLLLGVVAVPLMARRRLRA